MEPTQELVDDIYREKVLRARVTPPEEKLFAGVRLFEAECEWMRGRSVCNSPTPTNLVWPKFWVDAWIFYAN